MDNLSTLSFLSQSASQLVSQISQQNSSNKNYAKITKEKKMRKKKNVSDKQKIKSKE